MGKHGPCYHCGVTSTPLWRNGPPEKPVLCNACGSRWRTKGTLENYTPLHARADADEFEDYRGISRVKTVSIKNKEAKVLKRKYDNHNNYNNNNNINEFAGVPFEYNQGYRKGLDEDTSNRSSSGSAISNSESCAQYGSNADISDLTGPSQAIVWDTMVPSRKRTCVTRSKPSPVEKLTRDLYTIWHEQQSSCLSAASSEEELLLESDKPMVSVEIGHGTVLIRHPSSIAREEESEASSLSIDNKIKKPANPPYEQHKIIRDRCQLNELQIMAHHKSPLCYIDLQDIVNFDNFANHFTTEEQQRLLKFLPSIDTKEAPERDSSSVSSLKSMFNSPQLKENLLSYQKLVADGLFDNSLSPGLKTEECRALKKFVLCNSTKSKWVEQYKTFKDLKGKNIIDEPEAAGESNTLATDSSLSVKRSRDGLHQKVSGGKAIMKSPRRIMMTTTTSSYDDQKEIIIDKGLGCSFFSQKRVYDDVDEHDLLLDVPSNGSFPQAELLPASASSSSVYPNFVRP